MFVISQKIIFNTIVLLFSITGLAQAKSLVIAADSVPVLNRPAPEFHLKNLDGKIVSLSDFKGKIVVLDFWATWCVPCQESFPAMEKAQKYFADNNNVVFLYIDTRETSADFLKIVKAQMKKRQYPFHVLIDETGPAGLQNKQYLIYGMPGIPTKYIIDKKGIIRYELIGFNPKQSADENAAELINLVERTKTMGD
ncbi:TlpA family protein disulfide reductase [Pedobacter duraquae]|uniref:Peroxiredoxin n=1 Tax=Pedobacter duraquae TaxID=425511 RepID=A0A4R6IE25_9SPHI|nr:TlpA disulfide reductase family protein [Pedobacter duraquae]TDO20282.1 peroxiredoxin [Pedobacter duraquae]